VRFHQDKNNFGPRAGFTFDINGSHTTVIRGGWGLYYGRSSNSVISSALTNNAKTFATYTFTNPTTTAGAPQYPNVFNAPPTGAGRPSIQYLSPSLERPQINMAEFTVDRAIGTDITVSASYLYSGGSHLPTFVDTNLNPANANVEFIVRRSEQRDRSRSTEGASPTRTINNAIEVAGHRRFDRITRSSSRPTSVSTKGLLFNANYTLSKAEDTGQNSTTFILELADDGRSI
jgi:hypothetical protein